MNSPPPQWGAGYVYTFMVITGGSRKMVLNVAGDIIPKKFSKNLSDFDSNPYTRLCNLKQVFDYKSCSVFVSFSK